MPRRPQREHWHDACAKALMGEYGLDKKHLDEVVEMIKDIYDQTSFGHSMIITSIRGFTPYAKTRPLETFLMQHQTHPPKHKKGERQRRPEFRGKYEEGTYD